jgi:hypothetical protein
MAIGYAMCDMCNSTLMALTAVERWKATRQVYPRSAEEYSSLLAIGLLLLALVLLLWWVTHKRQSVGRGPARDLLSEGAARRGLEPRERQILLAIVLRSKLRRSHDIFTTPDAFDMGSAKLLEECARTRTSQECEWVIAEVASLREKMGYRAPIAGPQTRAGNSRNIPVGTTVELLRRRDPGSPAIEAAVIRNDELDIAVETRAPVASETGDPWRVRYHLDRIVWQFDTSAVSCEGNRLVLNHPEQVRVVERGRVDRLAVNAPAAVARFPFIQTAPADSSETASMQWFELVDGTVTQVSDRGLQIRSSLSVRPGDRVLVVFALTGASRDSKDETGEARHIVGHVGRVRHRQASSAGTLMTVELGDLPDREIDEFLSVASACASHGAGNTGPREPFGPPVRQGV